ncbi:Fur-regulated basic protein FbpA [Priestia endophytica]|nr:Fur-regulated basic protein FbpA [Priestia endophytica]MCY8232070.1 Fur-regulated basic protein FbpA [Priestia endophytica]
MFNHKEHLVQQLLELGIYKKGEYHLYELSVSELEVEYYNQLNNEKPIG